MNLDEYYRLVNDQISYLESKSVQYAPDHPKYNVKRTETFSVLLQGFRELAKYLDYRRNLEQINVHGTEVGKRLGNLDDIPEHMLKQAKLSKTDELDEQVISVIRDMQNVASVDEIYFQLYRKFELELERTFLVNKLGRMARKDLLIGVKGKRGIYELTDQYKNCDDSDKACEASDEEFKI